MIRFREFLSEASVEDKTKELSEHQKASDEREEKRNEIRRGNYFRTQKNIYGDGADDDFKKEYSTYHNKNKDRGKKTRLGFYLYFVIFNSPNDRKPAFYVGIKHSRPKAKDAPINNFWGSIRYDPKGTGSHTVMNKELWKSLLVGNKEKSQVPKSEISSDGRLYMTSAGKHSNDHTIGKALLQGLITGEKAFHPHIMNTSTFRNLKDIESIGTNKSMNLKQANLIATSEVPYSFQYKGEDYPYQVFVVDDFDKLSEVIHNVISSSDDDNNVLSRTKQILAKIKDDPKELEKIREIFSNEMIEKTFSDANEFFNSKEGKKFNVPKIFSSEQNYRHYIMHELKEFPYLLFGAIEHYVTKEKNASAGKKEKNSNRNKNQGTGTKKLLDNDFLYEEIYIPPVGEFGITKEMKKDLMNYLDKKNESLPEREKIPQNHFQDYDGEEDGNVSISEIVSKKRKHMANHLELLSRISFVDITEEEELSRVERDRDGKIVKKFGIQKSNGVYPPIYFHLLKAMETKNTSELKKYFENSELKLLARFADRNKLLDNYVISFNTNDKTYIFVKQPGGDVNSPNVRSKEKTQVGQKRSRQSAKQKQQNEMRNNFSLFDFLLYLGYDVKEKDTMPKFYERNFKEDHEHMKTLTDETLISMIFGGIYNTLSETHARGISGSDKITNAVFHKYMPNEYKDFYDFRDMDADNPEDQERFKERVEHLLQIHRRDLNKWNRLGLELFLHTITSSAALNRYSGIYLEGLDGKVIEMSPEMMREKLIYLGMHGDAHNVHKI